MTARNRHYARVDDTELTTACRPGVHADAMLAAALSHGATDEYADSGDFDHEGKAASLARVYAVRTRHLGRRGLLLVDEPDTLADLERFGQTQDRARIIVRTERGTGERVVYTAVVAGSPPRIHACLVHRLPD